MSKIPNCLLCNKELKAVFAGIIHKDGDYVQPALGNSFETYGTYGSEYFDPCDTSYLSLNLCDNCTEKSVDEGRILIFPEIKK